MSPESRESKREPVKSPVLRRVPGLKITSNLAIALPWAERRDDPNGYYAVLALEINRPVSMLEIDMAFRQAVKRFHPDGREPNVRLFRLVKVAYDVLSDPEKRRAYDAMTFSEIWPDEEALLDLARQTLAVMEQVEALKRQKLLEEATQKLSTKELEKQILGKLQVSTDIISRERDELLFYFYQGEELPSAVQRRNWFDLLASDFWTFRHIIEMKIGFTSQLPHVLLTRWGKILFVSGEPNPFISFNLVRTALGFPVVGITIKTG